MIKAVLLAALLALPLPASAAEQVVGVVYFTTWSALLDDAAQGAVKDAAARIDADKAATVTVTGYADTVGSAEANDLMAKLRAQIVIDTLVADGVPVSRLTRDDRGATPDIGGLNESRRVVIRLQ